MDEKLEQFVSITGCSLAAGRSLLEACGGNLDLAVNMHLEGGAGDRGGPSSRAPVADDGDHPGSSAPVCTSEANEPSYEELYGVRAPIPQTSGVLIEGEAAPRRVTRSRRLPQTVFDPFQDYSSSYSAAVRGGRQSGSVAGKKERLADLFKPPLDIMFQGTFNEARFAGRSKQKWLIVNLQDSKEFASQVLNRDIWSDHNIKDTIREHFIFWQIYRITDDGVNFKRLYHVDTFPCVCIIDPRTGEKMHHWAKSTAATSAEMLQLLRDFIDQHPYDEPCGTSAPPGQSREGEAILEGSEDQQLEAAIRASLQDSAAISSSPSSSATAGRRDKTTTIRSPVLVFSDEESDDCIITSAEDESDFFIESEGEGVVDMSRRNSNGNHRTHAKNGSAEVHALKDGKLQGKRALQGSSPHALSPTDAPRSGSTSLASPLANHSLKRFSIDIPCTSLTEVNSRKRKLSDNDAIDVDVPPVKRRSNSNAQSTPTEGNGNNSTKVIDLTSQLSSDNRPSERDGTASQRGLQKDKKSKKKSVNKRGQKDVSNGSPASCSPTVEEQLAAGSLSKDKVAQLLIRLPDGSRSQKAFLCDQPISELFAHLRLQGVDLGEWEVVTHFPKRNVSQLDHILSFREAGLYPRETLFLQ